MRRRTTRGARRGYTLIEMMIVVAMIGVALSAAWSMRGVLDAPGRPGHDALRQQQVTLALTDAHEAALSTPLTPTAAPTSVPSPYPALRLTRQVTEAAPGLLRIEWIARWQGRGPVWHTRTLTALKAQP